MFKPLRGVKVLDLSRILAGPYCAQQLADLGAEVLKIEAPWGDDTRKWGPPFTAGFDGKEVAAYFLSCNRGKTIEHAHLVNDWNEIKGHIEQSDIIIENFKPGTMEKFLDAWPQRAIICRITGYGQSGPRMHQPAYDLTMQARSGIMSMTGEKGREPVKVGVAWIDVMTGMTATSAILAALFEREKSGQGALLDLSLWDVAVSSMVNQAHNVFAGKHPEPMGSAHPNLVPYKVFKARDGWFALGIGSDDQWMDFSERTGLDAKVEWRTNQGRIQYRDKVEQSVQSIIEQRTRAELEALLQGIPCAPVNSLHEALEDEQSVERHVTELVGGVQTLSSVFRFCQVQNENKDV
jgi:crotonobetainyl-CoA:carnitine CoA-transferase CaiB-like acyl-CoA transferase